MALYGKTACIWHAYTALAAQNKGEVLSSQLKVLTHNIASCLGIQNVENLLAILLPPESNNGDDVSNDYVMSAPASASDDERSAIGFGDYVRFLSDALFGRLRDADLRNGDAALGRVDDVCWFVCAPTYLRRDHATVLDETNTFKLWRVFNVLADTAPNPSLSANEDPEAATPVSMDWEEVLLLVQRIHRILGTDFDKDGERREAEARKSFSFAELLKLIECRHLAGTDPLMIINVISELYDENIQAVMKKGYLQKRAHVLAWKERWCVLTPNSLYYYTSRDEKELKGQIVITDKLYVEEVGDKFSQKSNRFLVHTEHRVYELSAVDPRTRTEWTTAIKAAIKLHENTTAKTSLSKAELKQRRISRYARREKLTKEEQRLLLEKAEKERTLNELEQEKRKRSDMEAKMREEELQREMERDKLERRLESAYIAREDAEMRYREKDAELEVDRQRLLELEELQRHLESLLENERRAREAEAVARQLQETALAVEQEKKRHLEQMRVEMEQLLIDEQQKREDLEEVRQRQEALLLEEKRQLRQLELESERRQKECEVALAKLREAENEKEEMKRQLEKKKVFLAAFTGDEPIFVVGSHRGADPGARSGLAVARTEPNPSTTRPCVDVTTVDVTSYCGDDRQ